MTTYCWTYRHIPCHDAFVRLKIFSFPVIPLYYGLIQMRIFSFAFLARINQQRMKRFNVIRPELTPQQARIFRCLHSIPPGQTPSVHRRTVAVSYGYGDGVYAVRLAAEDTVIVEGARPLTP